jgi:hypothetical protein
MATTTTEKHSITLPLATSAGVRERVGSRGFSAYIANATARQLQMDLLDDLIAEMEAEHGPVDQDDVDAISRRLGW